MSKHNHREAFCHMQYSGHKNGNTISLTIWNSRDGVTPFVTFSREYGVELQHVNWPHDRYNPEYKPKKGDLIWVSHTEETAREAAEDSYSHHYKLLIQVQDQTPEELTAQYGYNIAHTLQSMLSDKDQYIAKSVQQCLYEHDEPQPLPLLVKEDW